MRVSQADLWTNQPSTLVCQSMNRETHPRSTDFQTKRHLAATLALTICLLSSGCAPESIESDPAEAPRLASQDRQAPNADDTADADEMGTSPVSFRVTEILKNLELPNEGSDFSFFSRPHTDVAEFKVVEKHAPTRKTVRLIGLAMPQPGTNSRATAFLRIGSEIATLQSGQSFEGFSLVATDLQDRSVTIGYDGSEMKLMMLDPTVSQTVNRTSLTDHTGKAPNSKSFKTPSSFQTKRSVTPTFNFPSPPIQGDGANMIPQPPPQSPTIELPVLPPL